MPRNNPPRPIRRSARPAARPHRGRRAALATPASRRPAARRRLKVAPRAAAVLAAALLVLPYAAAPLLGQAPPSALALPAPTSAISDTVTVPDTAAAAAPSRGEYTVTRMAPRAYAPYAHTADTFTNNPNSPVQWPFTQGVPIRTWFSAAHEGLDMNPGVGTPVRAIADGVVVETGNPSGTYGVYAVIEHTVNGQSVRSLYGHMQEKSLAVSVGDTVTVGQLVGQVGSSGASTGPHLHLSIFVNGTAIDPYAWLKQTVLP
jgi:murein DD-endopeptidase MepM/ murein hydrolase activator NlpD